jgi:hypothetical protein
MEATRESLLARAAEWDRAILERDREVAAGILADDYALVLVHPTPATMPRERWLEVLPEYVVHAWEVEEQAVDINECVGTVLQRVRMEATVLGEDRSGLFVITDVWLFADGEWRVWRRHSSPLDAGPMPGAAVDLTGLA